MNLSQVLSEEILPCVEKPSRYLGTEVNAVHKDPSQVEVRLALAFPDLYDLGLGNLGLHILYAVLNKLDWCFAERAYAPGLDMEKELRSRGLPLFALESKDGLDTFDGIGFTLQSELTYTNILNMLDLCGIPLRAKDRGEAHPLTFAGGPAVFNPEPLAPFMDFFVIGDGEDVVLDIARTLRKLAGQPRRTKLLALSFIQGVYVPALYPFETLPDGRVLPREDAPKITKRTVKALDGERFPVEYIVPYAKQVHDRISLEVLRGCTQGCRFCQAGMTTRPVRERTVDQVTSLMQRTLDATGYEEVSLVSLSTCDHSMVRHLVEQVVDVAQPQKVSVSLPSLRLDSWSVELSDMVADTRRTGLTFAPEAASPRLRAVINKWIPDEELLEMSAQTFAKGWDRVKLYFMIGLPTERDDDIHAIADLTLRTLDVGKEHNRRAKVNTGVSTFVPKPFTPFQWAPQLDLAETERRQDLLQARFRDVPGVKFGRHHPETTFLEGLVSRADRRAGDLLERAWELGCRFDAWDEHLRFDLWQQAIEDVGYDVAFELRERALDERLPWDHIDIHMPKQWFVEDWQRATELQWAPDCRHKKCHKCGVIDVERELCASMLRDNVEGRKVEATWQRTPRPSTPEPDAVQRLWFRITRTGDARHLAHLEAMNVWIRALRRAKAPLAYSRGFHPHPKVAFSSANPTGMESTGDYLDITLTERLDTHALLERLQATLPEGFDALSVREVALRAPSLMSVVAGAEYTLYLPGADRDDVAARIADLLAQESIGVERETKARRQRRQKRGGRPLPDNKGKFTIDIRAQLRHLALRDDADVVAVDLVLVDVDDRPGRFREWLPLLVEDEALLERVRVLRRDSLWRTEEGFSSVSERPSVTGAP